MRMTVHQYPLPGQCIYFEWHRNLCIDGGYDICGEMYNKNILAPLKTFVPKVWLAFENCLSKINNFDFLDLQHAFAIS